MGKTKKTVLIALLVAQALVLHIIEGMIPVPFITPGAKLGLANIITITALYTFNFQTTLMIILIRLLLSSIFGGSVSGFLYSLSGAVLSLIAMYLTRKILRDKVSIIGVSAAGAVFHNLGQILMASLIIQNLKITLYLPILTIVGVGTGIFVGLTSNFIIIHMKKLPIFYGYSRNCIYDNKVED